tara:strand:- start:176 stop:421 length:246 start_codon:yes stop_codon:yes gene_type:complete
VTQGVRSGVFASANLDSDSTSTSTSGIDTTDKDTKPVMEREVVIVGSGPSGCTAAIYTGRALLNPLVVAGYNAGGQVSINL